MGIMVFEQKNEQTKVKVTNHERQLVRHIIWIVEAIQNVKVTVNCSLRVGQKISFEGTKNFTYRSPSNLMSLLGLLDGNGKSPYFREIVELLDVSFDYEKEVGLLNDND